MIVCPERGNCVRSSILHEQERARMSCKKHKIKMAKATRPTVTVVYQDGKTQLCGKQWQTHLLHQLSRLWPFESGEAVNAIILIHFWLFSPILFSEVPGTLTAIAHEGEYFGYHNDRIT